MELKNLRDQFACNHPKFIRFMEDLSSQTLQEGTIIEITVTTPEGKHMVSNLKLTDSDISMLESIHEMTN
ncbi:MAG: hypothetical protein ACI4EG_06595 [Fusicatenibacter sp.]